MKRALVVLAAVAALLLAACTPPPPPPPPSGVAKGFDACAAPSTSAMSAWRASPYTSVGVYIGGANRACAQPNLTSSWVTTVTGQGWKLLPIWVGPQASCTTLGGTTKLSSDPSQTWAQGAAQASAAADAAEALGLGWLTPIYYDMEAYPRGGDCTSSVQVFTNGWVYTLNQRGHLAGMYSSLCSGILDQAATAGSPYYYPLNAVWIAAWNGTPNIFGFGAPCALSDTLWSNHARVHQYSGGHNEAYGGITINIDSNAVDGPTYPR
jgi:Rv2525c-like, glycoside hydrolase-like domain